MFQSIKRWGGLLRMRLNGFMEMARDLVGLAIEGRLSWLLYFMNHRARYKINALYSGIMMNRNGKGDIYNLRRNIHRIEKGLIQKNCKQVFAEEYILEAIRYLVRLKEHESCDDNTVIWAEAVLKRYFSVCEHVGRIREAFELFKQFHTENPNEFAWYPYPAKVRPEAKVEYDALYQLAIRRRSVRYYLDKPVEFEVVRKAMEIGALSPGACNRQSFQFLFYNKKDVVNAICSIPGGYAGFEAPSVVIVVGRYRGYFDERDACVPIIDASLAVMSFIMALETLGLSSVCINWPLLPDRDKVLRRLIHLDDDEFGVMLIGIGYADPEGKIPFSAKRDINTLITCNERIISKKKLIAINCESSTGTR